MRAGEGKKQGGRGSSNQQAAAPSTSTPASSAPDKE